MCTELPGVSVDKMLSRDVTVVTDWPLTDTMTSPALNADVAAGPPATVWAMVTPLVEPGDPLPTPENWLDDVALTSMPMNAVAPMCTVDDEFPCSIDDAMARAEPIGMANACAVVELSELNTGPLDDEAAVSMPTTCPLAFTSAPPESPAWMPALISIMPLSVSEPVGFSLSPAVIDCCLATTVPAA